MIYAVLAPRDITNGDFRENDQQVKKIRKKMHPVIVQQFTYYLGREFVNFMINSVKMNVLQSDIAQNKPRLKKFCLGHIKIQKTI